MGKKTYAEGMNDAIKLWGTVCGRMPNCEECMLNQVAGDGSNCQNLARQFPAKTINLLHEMADKPVTYLQEYNLRFPASEMTIDMLIEAGMCRKLIFAGMADCVDGDCKACWESTYMGDGKDE